MKGVNKGDASVDQLSTPSTTSKFDDQTLNEVNKADGEKLVMMHIYLVVLYLRTLSSLVQQRVEVTRWSFIFRLPKTGKVSYNLA
jgi:hypothetical protein